MPSFARKSKHKKKEEKNTIVICLFKVYQCTSLIQGAGLQDVRKSNNLFIYILFNDYCRVMILIVHLVEKNWSYFEVITFCPNISFITQ